MALPKTQEIAAGPEWERVKAVFTAAIETDQANRSAVVSSMCEGDDELRAEVESWLESYSESDDFIERPVFSFDTLRNDQATTEGTTFGNYTIIREIGQGGMGVVFLAERTDGEFKAQVALKIVRQSVADRRMIERFRRERQILASLNHPNIARLLDGGISARNEPFLVMEYVDGITITEYVKQNQLATREVLKLFLKVCSALAYAHRNLIVHRDIKPGNILVTVDGEPKLLDFGTAKLLDDQLEFGGDQTQTGLRALTPAYASPEQLKGEAIATSSDIYSLGAVLYETLTGNRPFDLSGKNLTTIIRTVTETDAEAPSRVSEARRLSGDIDNIVLTSLRKEPERRYASIEQLSDDIKRQLDGRPVSARPNTFVYRTGKFVRRHWIGVTAAVVILITIAGGFAATIWQSNRALREKQRAEAVNAFLENLLDASNPSSNRSHNNGHDTTLKELMNEAAQKIEDGELTGQPATRAQLLRIIGSSYLSQGEYDLADKHLNAAFDLQQGLYGGDDPETLKTLVALAVLWTARGDNERADSFYGQRIDLMRTGVQQGTVAVDDLFEALYSYALLRRAQGDSADASRLLKESMDLGPRTSPDLVNDVGIAETVLALSYADQGRFEEADAMTRDKLARIESASTADSADLCGALTIRGGILMEEDRHDQGQKLLAEAEPMYRRLFSSTYLPLGDNLRLQAQNLYYWGKTQEAEAKIDEALAIYKQSSSAYINYPTALVIKGLILNKKGERKQGEVMLREAVRIRREHLPPDHFLVSIAESALGECLASQGKFDDARPLLEGSYTNLAKTQGEQNPRTVLAKARVDSLSQQVANLKPH